MTAALAGAPAQAAFAAAGVPTAWRLYAETLGSDLQAGLAGTGHAAERARADLAPVGPAGRPLDLSLWVDAKGRPVRLRAADAPVIEADLRALLAEMSLPPPPRGMLQPVRLAIHIDPAPPAAAPADPAP